VSPLRRVAHRTFSSLNSRNLRLYFAGLAISQIGSWVQLVSLPWLVLRITNSGTALGVVYALQFAPVLLLGAWGGVVADRYDKRMIQNITTLALGLVAFVLGALTLLNSVQMWSVVVLAVLTGVITAFDSPARRSFVAELVPQEELTNAVGLNNAVFTSARIIGPSIAGILIATIGIGWCFIVNAVSFVAVLVALQVMDRSQINASAPIARAKGQLRAGLRYAWNERIVRLAIIMVFVIGVFTFNYSVVLPLLAKRTFDAGASTYALMFAATGVGALFGALLAAHRARASGWWIAGSAIGFGVLTAAAAVAPTLGFEYLALVPMSMAGMVFLSMANAAIQERSDPDIRGRVVALYSVAFLGSTPIGGPIVGAVSQQFGARAGLAIGAIAAIVAGIAGLVALRRWVSTRPREEDARNRRVREPLAGVAG
jgi:MFS family permease